MSKPWGGAGAWAAEAERAEAEEKEQAAALAAVSPSASFPSLKEGVKQHPKKKKMTLSEFYAAGGSKDSGGAKGLMSDEMMRLPTGPKERSAEEMQYGRLGGGFSSYGGGGGGAGRREADREGSMGGSRRSYGGGYDEDRRGGGPMQARVSEFEPSRADGVDDWGAGKKAFVSGDAAARPSRGGFFGDGVGGDGFGGGASRADGVDSWAAGKRAAAPAVPVRSSTLGPVGFGFSDSGPDSGRWSRGGASFHENNGQERARLVLAPRNESNLTNAVASKVTKPSPFGAARPREEVLAEKGLDWKKLDSEIDKGLSRPTSSQSSRPNIAQSSRSENVGLQGGAEAKPRPKVNPFGDAKPREVLLEEKGKDWRKIDMKLERGEDRPETEEEKTLKDEINQLKKETRPDAPCIKDKITQKERELDQLARELDDRIQFGQKVVDRPGSGAGRAPGFSDRPPSRTGSVDEPRGTEFLERPRSRGTADVWSKSGDDRRPFQGGREQGFLGHRDTDRARTRDRW